VIAIVHWMTHFDFHSRTRLLFGENSLERLGELTAELGGKRVLLVTDAGLVKAGHADRVRQLLRQSGLEVSLFDEAKENPTTRCVEACRDVARDFGAETLVALGGGSSMDTAKGCNFLLTNGGRMQDYWGVGKASRPMKPLVAVPTTAGTGSECQCAALITDEVTHQKMACLDPKAAARVAVLDPVLTLTQPRSVSANTGIDALAHAVETAVTTRRQALSTTFSARAFQLLNRAFPRVMADGADLEARGEMLLGAALAGMAIEQSMLGAAHATANPLTARLGVVHGQAVGVMLPSVVRYNGQDPTVAGLYRELVRTSVDPDVCPTAECAVGWLADRLEEMLRLAGLPDSLRSFGVVEAQLDELVEHALGQWTGQFNPRPVSDTIFRELYQQAY